MLYNRHENNNIYQYVSPKAADQAAYFFYSRERTNILTENNENIAARNGLCIPSSIKILQGIKTF